MRKILISFYFLIGMQSVFALGSDTDASLKKIAAEKDDDVRVDLNGCYHPCIFSFYITNCCLTVTLTLLVASLTYKYVEVSARNYLNTLFDAKHKIIAVESVKA